MSQKLHIVLIGAAGREKSSDGQLPEVKNVTEAEIELKKFGDTELNIIVIDPALNNMTLEDELKLKLYSSAVRVPKLLVDAPYKFWELDPQGRPPPRGAQVSVYPAIQDYKDAIVYGDMSDDIRDTPHPVIFIDYTGKCKSSYEIMELLETPKFDNRWYIVEDDYKQRFNPVDCITKWKNGTLLAPYNIYLGGKIPDNHKEMKYIKEYVAILTAIIRNYLLSGFHKKLFIAIPEPWSMNLSTFALKGLLLYYGLYPDQNVLDKHEYPEREFAVHAQYRQSVTETLLQVCSNFVINNSVLTLEEFNNLGGLLSLRAWVVIHRRLSDKN